MSLTCIFTEQGFCSYTGELETAPSAPIPRERPLPKQRLRKGTIFEIIQIIFLFGKIFLPLKEKIYIQ